MEKEQRRQREELWWEGGSLLWRSSLPVCLGHRHLQPYRPKPSPSRIARRHRVPSTFTFLLTVSPSLANHQPNNYPDPLPLPPSATPPNSMPVKQGMQIGGDQSHLTHQSHRPTSSISIDLGFVRCVRNRFQICVIYGGQKYRNTKYD